jgi:MFS family permease
VSVEAEGGLWAPQRRALTTGLVLTITFIASEALAVVTVMPLVARDLHGLSLYGWVFSTFMLGSLVGIVVAGRDADRHGPGRPYVAGVALFVAGLLLAGLAPSMPVLVAGRLLQGMGAGAVPAIAYVTIGRSLPPALQPRMMAMLSTAWVVPGIFGPSAAAAVAHLLGWRWVFLGLVPIVGVTALLALPALVRLGRPAHVPVEEHKVLDALRTAAGAALVLGALASSQPLVGAGLGVLGALVGGPALRRLLPPTTLRAGRGLPATILSRGLLTFAFFGTDAYVTLTVATVRHHSTAAAGLVVTTCTLAWTAGSWVQARLNARWEGARLVRTGFVGVLAGIVGMAAQLVSGVPLVEAFVAWGVGGFAMGLAYAPTSLMMLRAAPAGREGWASASLNLADTLGIAVGIGVGGAAVAAVARSHDAVGLGVAVAFLAAGVAGVVGVLITPRLPRTIGSATVSRRDESSETPMRPFL